MYGCSSRFKNLSKRGVVWAKHEWFKHQNWSLAANMRTFGFSRDLGIAQKKIYCRFWMGNVDVLDFLIPCFQTNPVHTGLEKTNPISFFFRFFEETNTIPIRHGHLSTFIHIHQRKLTYWNDELFGNLELIFVKVCLMFLRVSFHLSVRSNVVGLFVQAGCSEGMLRECENAVQKGWSSKTSGLNGIKDQWNDGKHLVIPSGQHRAMSGWWWLEPWNFIWLSRNSWEWNNHPNWLSFHHFSEG